MPPATIRRLLAACEAVLSLAAAPSTPSPPAPDTELDAFMAQVLTRRDDNWRKLQQYLLDEHERAELLGPGKTRLYGMARDYTWYIRDGIFVRSPVRFDGVTLGEDERQRYERDWIEREQQRENRRVEREHAGAAAPPAADASASDTEALARLTREPQFVSMAYFLKFKFERGHYAFAGREAYEGQQVYRVEYYPSQLFTGEDVTEGEPAEAGTPPPANTEGDRISRQMNKVALVTMWIEPESRQVVRYVFENIAFDFLPARWLARVEGIRASMSMGEAFPGVWLPRGIEGQGSVTLASGTYSVRYETAYRDYREAVVKARIR
jgi:hypothetical protein